MANKIYIIEEIHCRGDVWKEKHSYDKDKFFSILDALNEDGFDEYGELSEEVSIQLELAFGEDKAHLEALLYNLLVGCADYCGEDLNFEERIQAIKSGKYCAELEESIIAVGFSPKEAKANLIDLEDEDDW